MKTVTKNLFGAAMLIGSALAIAMPASAQPNYGFYPGGGATVPMEARAITETRALTETVLSRQVAAIGAGTPACTGAFGCRPGCPIGEADMIAAMTASIRAVGTGDARRISQNRKASAKTGAFFYFDAARARATSSFTTAGSRNCC